VPSPPAHESRQSLVVPQLTTSLRAQPAASCRHPLGFISDPQPGTPQNAFLAPPVLEAGSISLSPVWVLPGRSCCPLTASPASQTLRIPAASPQGYHTAAPLALCAMQLGAGSRPRVQSAGSSSSCSCRQHQRPARPGAAPGGSDAFSGSSRRCAGGRRGVVVAANAPASGESTPVSREDLIAHLRSGCRPPDKW
jgi:hypothetical protein